MRTLSEKIIEQLQSKHDAFLGTKGEEHRQAFKNGLAWAIDTIETLTEIDKCEKEHQREMKILIAKRANGWYEFVVVDNENNEHRQFFLKEGDTMPIDKYIEIYNTKEI